MKVTTGGWVRTYWYFLWNMKTGTEPNKHLPSPFEHDSWEDFNVNAQFLAKTTA